ncbi:MAG: peptide chain release factor 1 [Dehalococcoidia bacterium]|nr:peptide chain release factor 1 [Dehalococcoidia bacterium]
MDPLFNKLESVELRYRQIEDLLASPEVASSHSQVQTLAKEHASLEELVSLSRKYKQLLKERADAQSLISEGSDHGLVSLARDEIERVDLLMEDLAQKLRWALVPKDPNDGKNVIMEIREGIGGQEASLFAGDLYRMYTRYAQLRHWDVEVLHTNPSGSGGFKEVVFEVRGQGAYSLLKFERGAHRVQRVPVTEASGRIHTSTATVAVLPEADEVDVNIHPDDLRIDIFHAGGHGGQNVNKVATAVRIVHIPTGTIAVCQDERSQFKNKQKAMAIMRARIYEAERQRQDTEIANERKSQVGSGERAEKIRTYNFPQDRKTDHRINTSFHGIESVLDGELEGVLDALASNERTQMLEGALN